MGRSDSRDRRISTGRLGADRFSARSWRELKSGAARSCTNSLDREFVEVGPVGNELTGWKGAHLFERQHLDHVGS